MTKPKVGECWTVKEEYYAEHMGGSGCPFRTDVTHRGNRLIHPGEVGIIAHIDVPKVRVEGSFICLDFIIDTCTYRARIDRNKIERLKGVSAPENIYRFCGTWHVKAYQDEEVCQDENA